MIRCFHPLFLISLCLGLLGNLACLAASSVPANNASPNIVLCMADDQGWGDMAYNGHPGLKTPCFDALAKEGLRFDRFYAAAPVCSPTRGSVLTGRHPNRFGCFSWGHDLRPQEHTIAEVLKSAGYVTGHFGKWHLGSVYKDSPVNPGASGFDVWISAPNFYDNDPILSCQGVAKQFRGESSMVAVDAAIDFIRDQHKANKKFLAVVWFGSPHAPHRASKEDMAAYPNQKQPLANFYGEISGMDKAFGKLRGELRRLGLRDNTLLWYCSDNGGLPKIGATGGRGNKGAIYEGGLRVPALLEWPNRFPKPRLVPVPCSTVDIFPTLVAAAGLKSRQQVPLDGINILPLLDDPSPSRPRPLGFWQHPTRGIPAKSEDWMSELLALQSQGKQMEDPAMLKLNAALIPDKYPEDSFAGHAAWLDWPWKLHRIESAAGTTQYELYNLQADPMERDTQHEQSPERAKIMTRQLEAWLASVTQSLNGKDY